VIDGRRQVRTRARDERIKRVMDVVLAGSALIVLSPVLAVVAAAIVVTDGRPILFRQARPGMGGRPFTIVKFRTMRPPRSDEVWYRTDADRLTRIGAFLRTSSLDELPELWNVVRGDMSLVGPRPLLMSYLAAYTPRQMLRQTVRPGITGWAIVHGRNELTFEERLELDAWYVEHRSLRLDARILGMTIGQTLRRSGADPAQDVDRLGFPLPPAPPAATGRASVDTVVGAEVRTADATGDVRRPGPPAEPPASPRL
jgi:sugar transferase EpsL